MERTAQQCEYITSHLPYCYKEWKRLGRKSVETEVVEEPHQPTHYRGASPAGRPPPIDQNTGLLIYLCSRMARAAA